VEEQGIFGDQYFRNFNFNPLREVVTPVGLFLRLDHGRIAMRIHTKDLSRLVGQVEAGWRRLAPSQPFSYTFMDDQFNSIYLSEQRMGGISSLKAAMANPVRSLRTE
jgi:putative ABC transport system permease protein